MEFKICTTALYKQDKTATTDTIVPLTHFVRLAILARTDHLRLQVTSLETLPLPQVGMS